MGISIVRKQTIVKTCGTAETNDAKVCQDSENKEIFFLFFNNDLHFTN